MVPIDPHLDDDKLKEFLTAPRPKRHLRLVAFGILFVVIVGVAVQWSPRFSYHGRVLAGVSTVRIVNQTGDSIFGMGLTVDITQSSTTETRTREMGDIRTGESKDAAFVTSDVYPIRVRYRKNDGYEVALELEGVACPGEIATYTVTPDGVTGPSYPRE